MADDLSNDDQWLYGDSLNDTPEGGGANGTTESKNEVPTSTKNDSSPVDQGEVGAIPQETGSELDHSQNKPTAGDEDEKNEGEIDEEEDDDDSDDDVNVVIGDIKTTPAAYSSLNIKRGGLLTSAGGIDKLKQPGKFSIEEFEQIGTINGIPTHEFNVDSLEDKPWRKPGADITDYFNYGFNEETWRAYCERQKRMRIHESGVGLGPLGSTMAATAAVSGPARPGTIPVAIVNDNSKYNAALGIRKAGPPPGRKMGGSIDVIGSGGGTLASRRNTDRDTPPKENVIQVMTADRREYSRKNPGFPDMSVPPPPVVPPTFDVPPPIPVPSPFPPPRMPMPPPPYGQEQFYSSDNDPYYQSYEPTQEQQWMGHDTLFVPRDDAVQGLPGPPGSSAKLKEESKDSPKSSSRDRDRSEREKDKHRSHRHRSRSRSPSDRKRRHKSRSRSPNHRSHRKKKSKKSEKSKEDDSD